MTTHHKEEHPMPEQLELFKTPPDRELERPTAEVLGEQRPLLTALDLDTDEPRRLDSQWDRGDW